MNKTALITGSAKGIGKAIAYELANNGYNLALFYNTSELLAQQLQVELTQKGVNCQIYKCDISNEEEVRQMVYRATKHFGKIDVLVNNAGIALNSLFHTKSVEEFKTTFNVNVIGTFLVSKYVGEDMFKNKHGKIINLSSTNGINTYYPMCIDYDASKSAINSLTHNLSMQFAPYVIVNAVAPGFIATESELEGMDDEFIKLEEEKVMVKRAGQPQEVAKLVCFLASDDANFINNQIIKIDGGIYGDY